MSEKLKPCPFCGDEVEIFETGLYHWNYAIRHKSKEECVLDAIAFVLPFEKDKAMRMWNERAEGEVRKVKCGDCKWLTEEKRSSV